MTLGLKNIPAAQRSIAATIGRKNRNQQRQAANGKLTQGQANRDTKQENAIHNQEKADAAANGGHITKGEQNQINHEQNQMNQKIDRQENRDASQPAPAGQ